MGKLPNQETTSGMMSHLDGSQIQKAIILAFPIPFWQNSTSVFGRYVHSKKTSVWNLSRTESASIKEMIERANNKVSYITSINPAAAGKFLHQNFQAKEHDSITISYNIDALVKAKGKLESLNKETTEQDNALFMANGLRLKPGMQCKHSANQKFLESILSIQSTVEETLELLQKAKQRVERIFPRRGNETIPESSTSRYGRKRTRVLRENYVPWNNIHVETQ